MRCKIMHRIWQYPRRFCLRIFWPRKFYVRMRNPHNRFQVSQIAKQIIFKLYFKLIEHWLADVWLLVIMCLCDEWLCCFVAFYLEYFLTRLIMYFCCVRWGGGYMLHWWFVFILVIWGLCGGLRFGSSWEAIGNPV